MIRVHRMTILGRQWPAMTIGREPRYFRLVWSHGWLYGYRVGYGEGKLHLVDLRWLPYAGAMAFWCGFLLLGVWGIEAITR